MNNCSKNYKAAVPMGPGGVHCPCCSPGSSVKESRIMINRAFRRKDKHNIKKELEDERTELATD